MTDPVAPTPAPVPAAGPKQTLSLVSFILAIVAVFLAIFVFGSGLLPGIAAIILSVLSRKREPEAPSWMRLIGLIGGIVAIVVGFIVFLVVLFATLLPLLATGAAISTSGY